MVRISRSDYQDYDIFIQIPMTYPIYKKNAIEILIEAMTLSYGQKPLSTSLAWNSPEAPEIFNLLMVKYSGNDFATTACPAS